MASSTISISSYRNPLDAIHAQVDLSGTAAGTLSFVISRTPVYADSYATTYSSTSPVNPPAATYNVVVPGANLYYVWAIDDNGVAAGEPAAVWVGLSNDINENLTGYLVRDILTANKTALEIALQSYMPGVTLKQIIYGSPFTVTDYPSILVCEPSNSYEYVSFPYGRLYTFKLQIFPMITHEDRASNLANVSQLTGAIIKILNSPPYEENTLSSGVVLYRCQCREGDAADDQVEANKWAATSQIAWSSEAYIIDTYQGVYN